MDVAESLMALADEGRAAVAMARSEHADTARHALACLKMLAWRPGAEEALVELGAPGAILEGMRRHPRALSVLEAGAGTLGLLCMDAPERAEAAAADGALEILVHAVRLSLDASACGATPEATLLFTSACSCLATMVRQSPALLAAAYAAGADSEWLLLDPSDRRMDDDHDEEDDSMEDGDGSEEDDSEPDEDASRLRRWGVGNPWGFPCTAPLHSGPHSPGARHSDLHTGYLPCGSL